MAGQSARFRHFECLKLSEKLSDESETAGETAREKDGETAGETAGETTRETAENRPNNRIQFDHLPDINSRNNLKTAGLLRSTVVFIVPGILFSSKLKVRCRSLVGLLSVVFPCRWSSPVCGLRLSNRQCLYCVLHLTETSSNHLTHNRTIRTGTFALHPSATAIRL